MESEAKIRRMFFVQKLTIAEIVRKTSISRNTVRRIIRADKAGRIYQRESQPRPVLGPFQELLEKWLNADHRLSRKERRSAQKYFTQLKEAGYAGAYDSIQRFVKNWRLEKKNQVMVIFRNISHREKFINLTGVRKLLNWAVWCRKSG